MKVPVNVISGRATLSIGGKEYHVQASDTIEVEVKTETATLRAELDECHDEIARLRAENVRMSKHIATRPLTARGRVVNIDVYTPTITTPGMAPVMIKSGPTKATVLVEVQEFIQSLDRDDDIHPGDEVAILALREPKQSTIANIDAALEEHMQSPATQEPQHPLTGTW